MLKPISPDATIGICAPAGAVRVDVLERAIARISSLGFKLKLTPSVYGKHGFLSATDEIRKEELESLFNDPEVDTVWCARGGVGTSRLLSTLNLELIASSDKPFLGFSDLTALQWALWGKHRVTSFSGPLAIEFDDQLTQETREFALQILAGTSPDNWLNSFPNSDLQLLRSGAREIIAPLMPGNLTMITTLLGTPWMPDLRGVILVIEDIAEPPYRVDRLLFHLRNAGILQNLAALVVGDFGWSGDEAQGNNELLKQSLLDATHGTSYPIITGFPYGHGATRMTLPVGSPMRLSIARDQFALSYAISPFDSDI
ncbi:MAG: LD-carboxypeptidase [bacterium]|nr:LD-carboxypeptidase [bacterium]